MHKKCKDRGLNDVVVTQYLQRISPWAYCTDTKDLECSSLSQPSISAHFSSVDSANQESQT